MVKISIGVTFCDRDYQNYDKLLKQIKERVKVDYEVIIIDNTEGNKLGDKATFAFGYNAYQFAARYKIVKLAKGEYLWFIDGDDEVVGLEEVPFTDDVIAFSINGMNRWPDKVYTQDFFNWEFIQITIRQALWNKLIKRSLYKNIDKYIKNPSLKVVTLEDTFYVALALMNAKSVRTSRLNVYKHKRGISDALEIKPEQFDILVTGFRDVVKLFGSIGFDEEKILKSHFFYLSTYITKCFDSGYIVARIMELYPDRSLWINKYEELIYNTQCQDEYDAIRKAFVEKFGEESIPLKTCRCGYADGTVKEIKFEPKVIYQKWNHGISICGIVYEGNQQYLDKFVSQVKSRVFIDYEIIMVDNREDQSTPLQCDECVKIIPMGTNKGTVSGRRAGVNAATKDYVWLVDLDDEPLMIKERNFGEADLLILPVYWESGESDHTPLQLKNVSDMYKLSVFCDLSVVVWNKWIKREVAIKAYDDIPEFFCIYNEDNMLYYALCKNVKSVHKDNGHPVYTHLTCDNSTTRSMMTTEKQIDKMFIGFDESIAWQKKYMKNHPDISYENPYQIHFYLVTMYTFATDKMKPYFAKKLFSLYGLDAILHSIDVSLKDYYEYNIIWARELLPYFKK